MDVAEPSRRSIIVGSIVVAWLAIALRVPSCYESFWLDELHSAWCVWGSIGEVLPRAQIGHQSPIYFYGLWCWKQIAGESELLLRLSSVLAVAASCAVLIASVSRWTKSISAGVASGLVIAIESNAIFFGTELRPYAFVLLIGSIATASFLQLTSTASRQAQPKRWSLLIITLLLSAIFQPTSLGVLFFLPAMLCGLWIVRDRRSFLKIGRLDLGLGLMAVVVGTWLWTAALGDAWQQRSNWASFAEAARIGQIWELWPWDWLLFVPIGFAIASAAVARSISQRDSRDLFATLIALAVAAVAATSLYWIVTRMEWVPLWHRRYMIAVLPLCACVAGGSVGYVESLFAPRPARNLLSLACAALLALGLAHQQGTLQRLPDYPVALAVRGEDWRAANAWVRANAQTTDQVYLDAGLVEANAWLDRPSVRQLEYLVYAVKGPYDIDHPCLPTNLAGPLQPYRTPPEWRAGTEARRDASRLIVICRHPADLIRQLPRFQGSRIFSFGNLCVVVRPSVDH